MADGTPTAPMQPAATAPVAPQAAAPTTPPAETPAQGADTQPAAEPYEGYNEAMSEFNNSSPDTFINTFLEQQGVPLTPLAPQADGQQEQSVPPTGQPPVQPTGNVGQPTPNVTSAPGQPPQPAPVDAALVARLMAGQVAQPSPQGWPGAPAPALPWAQPAPQAPAPQAPPQAPQGQQGPVDINTPPQLFTEPVALPDQLAQGLNHDDPNIRSQALGAMIAAAGNTIIQRYHKYMVENVMPLVSQQTVGEVQRRSFQEQVHRDLFGPFPHLRYASPALIQQAVNVVVQDEIARNPAAAHAPIPSHVWQRVGQLASEGLRQMASGYVPQMAPAPAFAQQPPQPQPPGYGWDAQGRPLAPQQGYYPPPQQQAAPWMSGQQGQPFGMPATMAATPESEIASFMQGGWGPQ